MKPTIDYMPAVLQRRVRRRWPAVAAWQLVLLGVMFVARASDVWQVVLLSIVGLGLLTWRLVRDVTRGARWEYVLEGRVLRLRRPWDDGWATIRMDDLTDVFEAARGDGPPFLEFVFRNGRRVLVEATVFGYFGDARQFFGGVRRVRPGVEPAPRDLSNCPACDADLPGDAASRCATAAGRCPARCRRSRPRGSCCRRGWHTCDARRTLFTGLAGSGGTVMYSWPWLMGRHRLQRP